MGVSMLVYVLSDGYELGVGMPMHRATDAEKDVMIASIGPFWDAAETWLVLGVGILLVAFPRAHGVVLGELYLPVALMLMGAAWLIMKTEGELQERAIGWARIAWAPMVGGMVLISMATPWVSDVVRERWFALPEIIALLAIPLMTGIALLAVRGVLDSPVVRGPVCWLPFVLLIVVFVLGFLGLAYSIYPFVVIGQMTIWQAASSSEALKVILVGVCISVPAIAGYTVFSYRVFRGKAGELKYA